MKCFASGILNKPSSFFEPNFPTGAEGIIWYRRRHLGHVYCISFIATYAINMTICLVGYTFPQHILSICSYFPYTYQLSMQINSFLCPIESGINIFLPTKWADNIKKNLKKVWFFEFYRWESIALDGRKKLQSNRAIKTNISDNLYFVRFEFKPCWYWIFQIEWYTWILFCDSL